MQGKQISGYTLQRSLGTGGMAEVWYAENKIGKKAAVKILLPKLCADENVKSRFYTEAKVMVELDHPNIRQVYDYGDIDGRPTIVMEYLEGDDLKARMKRGQRFTDEELKRWWNQLVDALNYTHQNGIVHRDIKPGNIFVDKSGNIKLLDFGIAKVRESISSTQTGQKLGTLMYMSPEQVKDSKHVDYHTDIYSLAVTFVHLVTGKKPYNSDTTSDFEISEQIVYKPLDLSGLPMAWQSFLASYLEKDPEKRSALRYFGNVTASAGHAEPDDEGTKVGDAPAKPTPQKVKPKPEPSENPKSRKLLWIAFGVAAAVALLVALLRPQEPTPTDPDTQAYWSCQSVEDYLAYMRDYGRNAKHYAEARSVVDKHVSDSTARAQKALAATEAQQKAAAVRAKKSQLEEQARIDAEAKAKKEAEAKAQKEAETERRGGNGSAGGHEYVDLGLPSGTLWATCNIGASKPEGNGNYYAWGETKPQASNAYSWNSYKYADGGYDKLTKYCSKSEYGNNGFTDNLTTLQAGDDPAAANWGSGWRTPSKSQWDELLANTTRQWTMRNGVSGRLFTSKMNGQTLFLPAAGDRWGGELYGTGSRGRFWSRSLVTGNPGDAWYLGFGSGNCVMGSNSRRYGFSVRPVREK